jgi:filamin
VTAHGPGIEKNGLNVNHPMEFTVDARHAGSAPLAVTVTDADQLPVDVTVTDNKDGTYQCKYVPKKHVKHVVCVTYGGVIIPNFPVRVSNRLVFVVAVVCLM